MKIIDERKTKNTYFDDIMVGDTFLFNENVYMRIQDIYKKDSIAGIFNSVQFTTGSLAFFEKDAKVSKVNAFITLK